MVSPYYLEATNIIEMRVVMGEVIKVAAVQLDCILGNKDANLILTKNLIKKAAKQGAKIVVIPELFDTGYRVEDEDSKMSSTIPGTTTDYISTLCSELNIHVVGAIIERYEDSLYDTAFIVGPKGLKGIYRKNYLWDKEIFRFNKGNSIYPVFDIGFCKIGVQICYEIGFPENARILALQGADIIAYPSAFGKPRLYAWKIATRSRALENGCFVIASNRIGTEMKDTVFAGNSRIVNPKGEVLAEAGIENDVIAVDIDLQLIEEQRNAIPYLKDLNCAVIGEYYKKYAFSKANCFGSTTY